MCCGTGSRPIVGRPVLRDGHEISSSDGGGTAISDTRVSRIRTEQGSPKLSHSSNTSTTQYQTSHTRVRVYETTVR